jgi:HK97 family phage major capsid protein
MPTDFSTTMDRTHPSRAARQIPETVAEQIIADAVEGSAALSLGNVFRMNAFQHRMPILSAFANAFWLKGGPDDTRGGTGTGTQADKDSAVKSRTKVEWDNVFVTPEELAVLVVVPDAWMADSEIAWEEIRREVTRAFSKAIDEAIFFGAGMPPATFGPGIVPDAITKGKVTTVGSGLAEGNAENQSGDPIQDLALDIAALGEALDGDGYDLTAFAARRSFQWRLRRLRGQDGQHLLEDRDGRMFLYNRPLSEVGNGSWDQDMAILIGGEWDKLKIGIRQDIDFRLFDQAVLTDPATNQVVYSAVEQDGKVLRATMRLGYAVPNPVKVMGGTFPFRILAPEGSSS